MKLLFLPLLLTLLSCQIKPSQAAQGEISVLAESHHPNEVPLDHKYFTVNYNPHHKLPNWVRYSLEINSKPTVKIKRPGKLFADPQVISRGLPYAVPADYDRQGYDPVLLAPSADFKLSQKASDETFMMTNVVPQKRSLRQGAWKNLEEKIRSWACTEKKLTVISGPFLSEDLPKFKSGVSIPKKFFKVVIDEKAPRKAIAFIYDQDDGKKDLKAASVSVQDVEFKTGFEFITATDAKERKHLQTKFKLSEWKASSCK